MPARRQSSRQIKNTPNNKKKVVQHCSTAKKNLKPATGFKSYYTLKMTAMFSEADFPPLPCTNADLISDAQRRAVKAEEALKTAIAEKNAVEKELFRMFAVNAGEQSYRHRKLLMTPRSQWSNPTVFMVLEAALYTMAKKDEEISAMQLKQGIVASDDRPLLRSQTNAERNWHNWMYVQPDSFFNQKSGSAFEENVAWATWLEHLDESAAK